MENSHEPPAAATPPADVSNTTPLSGSPSIAEPGGGASAAASAREAAIAEATRAAIADFQSGQPAKRGNGQRGPDKQKRKPRSAPVAGTAPLAGDAGAAFVDDLSAGLDSSGGEPFAVAPEPIFDEKTVQFLAGRLTAVIDQTIQLYIRNKAYNRWKDRKLSREYGESVALEADDKKLYDFAFVGLAKKYGLDLEWAPEVALVVAAGRTAASVVMVSDAIDGKEQAGEQAQATPL